MNEHEGTPTRVLLRDFAIFQLKTWMDGLKDAAVIPLSFIVLFLDLAGHPSRRGQTFYRLIATTESFDRWLNLQSALKGAQHNSREGMFAGSEPGDGTLVGELEDIMGREARVSRA